MLRAIQLGKNALGSAAPNPAVGCVIVCDDKVIGEGFTNPYGGAHAEVNAIESVKDKSLLSSSTVYVSLEPCSHFGKTPPCTDLLLRHKVKRVCIGLIDPYKKVAGRGIKKLKEHGTEVTVGILEKECREHLKRFLSAQEKQRPYITLKWAETADGFIAPEPSLREKEPQPYWISNPLSQQLSHQMRTQEMAILVGTQTALVDNPKLNARNWAGKNPIRIVIDKDLKIPKTSHLLSDGGRTYIFTRKTNNQDSAMVTHLSIDFSSNVPQQICTHLHQLKLHSLLIEGGTKTLQSFIHANLWDEAYIFKGESTFGAGLKAPEIQGTLVKEKQLQDNQLIHLKND